MNPLPREFSPSIDRSNCALAHRCPADAEALRNVSLRDRAPHISPPYGTVRALWVAAPRPIKEPDTNPPPIDDPDPIPDDEPDAPPQESPLAVPPVLPIG